MNLSTHNDLDRNAAMMDAERSLRLIATLPAPVGIEDRVKAGLRSAPASTGVMKWPLSSPNRSGLAQVSYLRAAAAAAIVFVVAGGGWGVFTHFGAAPMPAAEAVPQRIGGGGGLSPAGAMRTPKTVDGPKIAVPGNGRQGTNAASDSKQKPAHKVSRQDQKREPLIPAAPAVH